MPLVARKDGVDVVNTIHVSVGDADPDDGIACDANPQNIATDAGSGDVFVVGHGIHRKTDLNEPHTHCPPVYSTDIVTHSPDVFANDLEVARIGDTYSCDAKVKSTTQTTVFANE